MKKIFAVLALVSVLASCKDKKEDKKVEDTTVVTPTTTTDPAPNTTDPAPTTASTEVPKFTNPDVQKWVNDYDAYITSVINAYQSKNAAKAQELSAKASEWTAKSQEMATKSAATPDEVQRFSDYIMAKSKAMTDAMMVK